MADYSSMLIEAHPVDTLQRIQVLLALHDYVDWDSPVMGAREGEVLLDCRQRSRQP